MSYIEQTLSAGEEIVEQIRLHWYAWFPMSLWVLVGFVTLGLAWWLALYEYLRLRMLEQGVTNRRLVLAKGIVNRSVEDMDLRSIRNVEVLQGALGRYLGFGTVRVTGSGNDVLVFKDIEDPGSVKRRLEAARNTVE